MANLLRMSECRTNPNRSCIKRKLSMKFQRRESNRKDPRTWAITSAIAVGVTILFFAIGIPVKEERKIDIGRTFELAGTAG